MDAIITYVDITESFEKEYNIYCKKTLQQNRFRSYGVLDLQIKLIRKYMPYIKNIFVIVSNEEQVNGIDLSGAKVITHDKIIPPTYLPCFNSCTIEMFMWKIPELSEEFVYFNDDTFVVNYIHPTKWFIKGKPCLNPKLNDIDKYETNAYKKNCERSTEVIASLLNTDEYEGKYITQAHIARPFLKSTCKYVFNKKIIDIQRSLTRTRHSKNLNATLFNNYDYISGNYYNIETNYAYLRTYDNEEIEKNILGKEYPLICINDNDTYIDFDEFKIELRKTLKANLNNKKYVKQKEKVKEIVQIDNTPLKVALCAIAKNENLYIREWVEWYKKLGISKIFLYDNNELDGERFEEVINDYIESGFVEIIDRRGIEKGCYYDENDINLQPKSYIECYENNSKYFDWFCFFDIDEFLTFRDNWNLFSFLSQDKFNNTDLILVSWQHYDDNNLLYYDSRPVTERFTHECKWYRHGVKSIVRSNKIINDKHQGNLIHIFRLKGDRTNYANGVEIRDKKTWYIIPHGYHISAPCVLNHYKTKTLQEYIKRHLGRHWGTGKKYTDHAKDINDCMIDFFKYNEETEEKLNLFKKYSLDTEYIKNELVNYGKKINCPINLDVPRTIQDKINWLKVYDSTELKTKCADKILVHEYCKEKIGKDICLPIINTYNNAYELLQNWKDIPNNVVIKTNHGSGFMVVIKDKSKVNKNDIYNKFKHWLMIDYGLDHFGYQIHYSGIKRKILVEPLMSGEKNDKLLKNYKFHCFNGIPKILEIYTSDGPSNDTRERMNFYDMSFNLLNISQYYHDRDENRIDDIPINYGKMLDYAKKLSKDFIFVRVDFYEIEGELYLGELTFTPNNGFIKYNNDDIWHTSEYLGNLLILSK